MRAAALVVGLAALAASCHSSGRPETPRDERPRRSFRFVTQAAVDEVPAGARELRLWIPVPADGSHQRVGDVRIRGTVGGMGFDLRSGGAGNVLLDTPRLRLAMHPLARGLGRSLCVIGPAGPMEAEVSCDVTRYEARGGDAGVGHVDDALLPDVMIPLDGVVAAEARALETPPGRTETARALYDHVLSRMDQAERTGPVARRGDAELAAETGAGDSADSHSLFIGLARSKGIPARFEAGFPVPAEEGTVEITGYRCWAWFRPGGRGWVPVDLAAAEEDPERADWYFGHLDANRVAVSGGRDVLLEPAPAAGALNFFAYPHAEADGEPVEVSHRHECSPARSPD